MILTRFPSHCTRKQNSKSFKDFATPPGGILRFRYHSQAISQEKISEEIL